MKQTIEFHLKGEDFRTLLVELDDGEIYLSLHMMGGHSFMKMNKDQSKLLFEAMDALKKAQEGP